MDLGKKLEIKYATLIFYCELKNSKIQPNAVYQQSMGDAPNRLVASYSSCEAVAGLN